MADLRQVKTRLASAHTAIEVAAALLGDINYIEAVDAEFGYMQRELHKILGRLEALEAGISNRVVSKRRRSRSTIEAGGEDAQV